MGRRRVLWLDITALCSGDRRGKKKTVDGVAEGEVRLIRGKKGLFRRRDDGFAVLLPLETPSGVLARGRSTPARPDSGGNTPGIGKTAAYFRVKALETLGDR